MLEGHKVVALCCSEIQNENTQSMVLLTLFGISIP